MNNNGQNGAALIIVLIFILLFSIAGNLAFQQFNIVLKESRKIGRTIQLKHIAIGGIYKTINAIRNGDLSEVFELYDAISETCVVERYQDGLFQEFIATSYIGRDTVKVKATIGQIADNIFANALSLTGSTPMLVISTGTVIDGDVALNEGLIRYSPPYVEKQKPVIGKITEDSTFIKSIFRDAYIDSLITHYKEQLGDYDLSEFLVFEGGIYSLDELKGIPAIIINGDCILQTLMQDESIDITLTGVNTIICKNNFFLEGKIILPEPITIIAGDNIFIKDSTKIEDALIYCQGGLYFENYSQVRGQFFSEKQIMVKEHAKIHYPSYLIVPVNIEKTFGDPEIALLGNSIVEAGFFVYKREETSELGLGYAMPGRIKIEPSVSFTGGIYCEGNVELYGNIKGFIHAENLEQTDKQTRWTNYLKNTQISRYNLSPHYPLPPIFYSKQSLSILEMTIIDN